MGNIKFKKILKEAAWDRTQGKALPTLEDVQKSYEAKKHLQEGQGYLESMNHQKIIKAHQIIEDVWHEWKSGPMTEKHMIKPAAKELKGWFDRWFKNEIR